MTLTPVDHKNEIAETYHFQQLKTDRSLRLRNWQASCSKGCAYSGNADKPAKPREVSHEETTRHSGRAHAARAAGSGGVGQDRRRPSRQAGSGRFRPTRDRDAGRGSLPPGHRRTDHRPRPGRPSARDSWDPREDALERDSRACRRPPRGLHFARPARHRLDGRGRCRFRRRRGRSEPRPDGKRDHHRTDRLGTDAEHGRSGGAHPGRRRFHGVAEPGCPRRSGPRDAHREHDRRLGHRRFGPRHRPERELRQPAGTRRSGPGLCERCDRSDRFRDPRARPLQHPRPQPVAGPPGRRELPHGPARQSRRARLGRRPHGDRLRRQPGARRFPDDQLTRKRPVRPHGRRDERRQHDRSRRRHHRDLLEPRPLLWRPGGETGSRRPGQPHRLHTGSGSDTRRVAA